jgi:DNA-binding NtrC family response regulator
MNQSTLRPSEHDERPRAELVPGVALLFSGGTPRAIAMPLCDGAIEIGRGEALAGRIDDPRISRRHARVTYEERRFTVTDLGSQNGTFADGEPVRAGSSSPVQRVVRVGDSLLMPLWDITALERRGVRSVGPFVRGPAMQTLLDEVARAAQMSAPLHIRGESGTGKEGVALAFHGSASCANRPFVAVNCAAIPQNIAERLLFGAKRGAYSGADTDAVGYIQEANGGTLFLDEIAELDLAVQAKLLRTLESKEVLPLGAARARKVDFQFCSATNKDLRALVAAGKLRDDLYFRIGRPEAILPALRDRPEEIAYLLAEELQRIAPPLTLHVSLVEQCLLRPWPGNVRELLAEARAAAQSALAAQSQRVTAAHLAAGAGSAFSALPTGDTNPSATRTDGRPKRAPAVDEEGRRRIEEALRENDGNVAASARALGLHRTQLRRLLARHEIPKAAEGDEGD